MSRWLCLVAVAIVAGALLAGCSTGSARQEIHGEITLDGQPVKEGHVRFAPADGKGSSGEAFIKEGQYTVALLAGNYKVEIYAPRAEGKMTNRPRGPGAKAVASVETIPAKYNIQTTLTKEVKPGVDVIDFPLTTQ